jgi:serine/threonine protein kinase
MPVTGTDDPGSRTPLPGRWTGLKLPVKSAGLVMPSEGDVLGNCTLEERLGQGSSSVVYRARHRKLNIPVAVKVLHTSALAASPELRERLRSEAVLLAQLNHPNVVRVWDFDDEAPLPYLVMEYVEGSSLAERIRQCGRIPQDWALSLIGQVIDGLAAAQAAGIVHRDLKPDNILLTRDGRVKLADLGLAVVVGSAPVRTGTPADSGIAGTAGYVAPEQARSAPDVDHRADIYSLGCTLFHALTGRLPFEGKSAMQVILRHLKEPPTPPELLAPGIEPSASALVLRMMAKEPAARFQTYADLRATVARVLDGGE